MHGCYPTAAGREAERQRERESVCVCEGTHGET